MVLRHAGKTMVESRETVLARVIKAEGTNWRLGDGPDRD